MQTTIFNKKALAFFGAAAILLAAVFTIGCKTDTGSGDPAPETFAVAFSVDGGNGKLKAKADGVAETTPSPITVEKGKTVTFTATPKNGYKVDKWTITGGTFEAGTGTEGNLTAKVTISANTKVNVSFKTATITPPSPTEFTVEMTAGEHGTLSANPVIPASGKVAKDTVITFTAAPASGYKVDKWTITGGAFEAGTGTEGSTTAKVKITANTKVNVSFKTAMYTEVPFGTDGADLDNYLKTAVPDTNGICYIKVTGLTAADLKGQSEFYSYKPSALGKILNDNQTKKVALKLSEVSGLTDMSFCFSNCENLTQALAIPSSVTNMNSCFYGCKSLTQAPVIPNGVTDMEDCFSDCKSLTQAPVIPSGVTNMTYCFSGCWNLTQAPVIPSGVIYMGGCFEHCESLTQAPEIPSSVTNMSSCFSGCTSLTQAPVIPSGVTYMRSCFLGCRRLTQAPVIPSSVTDIGFCFSGCWNLTQAPEIPSSVTNMNSCFFGCKKITAITLKCNYNSKKDIFDEEPSFADAFKYCEKLTAGSIKVPAGQVQTYKDNAYIMGTTADRFVAE